MSKLILGVVLMVVFCGFSMESYFIQQAEESLKQNPDLICHVEDGLRCCDPNYVKDCK